MNKEKLSLLVVLLLGIGTAMIMMGSHDFWQVEAEHLLLSRPSMAGLMDAVQDQGTRPPLYYLLLKAWSYLFRSEVGLRMLSLLFMVGAVWITFRLASLLFCWRTGFVAAALCAVSPLWAASAGVMVAPYGLDLFLCTLILHTFCQLLVSPAWKRAAFHGLALSAGVYVNPLLLLLVLSEGFFLAVHCSQFIKLWPRWICAIMLVLVFFLPWMPIASRQMSLRSSLGDRASQSLGLRVSSFLTEISLGRLYAWYPRTPVLSLTPTRLQDATPLKDRPDVEDDDPLATGMQALQMIFLSWYMIFAVVGMLAAMKVSAWPLPVYLRARQHALLAINQLRAARGQACTRAETGPGQIVPRQSALLLSLCFLVTLVLSVLSDLLLDWKFIHAELAFLTVPFYIMVARGIGTLEWKVMFYGAIVVILVLNLFFGYESLSYAPVTDGAKEAAAFLDNQIQSRLGDAVIHAYPLTFLPMKWYQHGFRVPEYILGESPQEPGDGLSGAPWRGAADLGEYSWLWWIHMAQPEDSRVRGCSEYLASLYTRDDLISGLALDTPPGSWKLEESHRFGDVKVSLFIQAEER
ncbi:MAG: glycosyltransferase family 39 protein [Planctomycetota bacterium]